MVLSASIPFEIIDAIIDHNYEDTNTLSSCSLVAHSFVDSCQKHLFSTVFLNLLRPVRYSEGLLDIFIANPRISSYVRHIYLQDYVSRFVTLEDDALPGILSSILSRLHHLQTFTLVNLYKGVNYTIITEDWAYMPKFLQNTLLTLFTLPSLTAICIGDFFNFPIHHFRQCPQLKRLNLHSIVEPASNKGQFETSEAPVPILESLEINDESAKAAKVLEGLLDLSQLRELRINGRKNNLRRLTADIMRRASQTITYFIWEQFFDEEEDFEAIPPDLDLMSNLRTLTLLFVFHEECAYRDCLDRTAASLEGLAGYHTLEEINIILHVDPRMVENPYLWDSGTNWLSKFEAIIATGDFPRLRQANITMDPSSYQTPTHALDIIQKNALARLPLPNEQGKATVTLKGKNYEGNKTRSAREISSRFSERLLVTGLNVA